MKMRNRKTYFFLVQINEYLFFHQHILLKVDILKYETYKSLCNGFRNMYNNKNIILYNANFKTCLNEILMQCNKNIPKCATGS